MFQAVFGYIVICVVVFIIAMKVTDEAGVDYLPCFGIAAFWPFFLFMYISIILIISFASASINMVRFFARQVYSIREGLRK